MNKRFTGMCKAVLATLLLFCGGVAAQGQTPTQVKVGGNVFGGGNKAAVLGNTGVTVVETSHVVVGPVSGPVPDGRGCVYGGGALANVGTDGDNTTTVTLLAGTVRGHVFGGGLGDNSNAAAVNGVVTVNIGATDGAETPTYSGDVVIEGSVYGCNNTNGSPQDNVTVHIYKTHRESSQETSGSAYAIDKVFGGGRKAHYTATGKTAKVFVHGCDNTVNYVFGGGDAANATGVEVEIDGGRFNYVFGGGNGAGSDDPAAPDYNPGADIGAGGSALKVHGGVIANLFGGSNEKGDFEGASVITVDNESGCQQDITDFFGGSNKVDLGTPSKPVNVNTTISCGTKFTNVYGGCNEAKIINGNVTLSIEGGTITNVYGGSKGVANSAPGVNDGTPANINGNVTLNLYGGTITNAFGGSHINGNITGKITVNVLDYGRTVGGHDCALHLNNLYGAGRETAYHPANTSLASPEVNLFHGTISKNSSLYGNVFGGAYGDTAVVEANPTVTVGYDATTMSSKLDAAKVNKEGFTLPASYAVTVEEAVYGGGEKAPVTGSTTVLLQDGSNTVAKLFGGGSEAGVSAAANVTVAGGSVTTGVYGGCNTSGTVGGAITVNVTDGTIGADGNPANVHGGGYGNNTATAGNVNVTVGGGEIWGDVYGGSALGNVNADANNTTNVSLTAGTIHGSLYGGGLGDNNHAAAVNGKVQVSVSGGTVDNVFGANNANGAPQSTVTVDISGSTCSASNVFGGGNEAHYGGTPVVTISDGTVGNVYGGGNNITGVNNGVGGGNVTVSGGHVTTGVYGGCNTSGVTGGPITVNVTGGAIGTDANNTANVHGGGYGNNTSTTGNVNVTVGGGVIWGDVYGGSALGDVNAEINNTTNVSLTAGTIHGSLYGGGLGNNSYAAAVNGTVQVTVESGTVDGAIFGCNNANGSPKGAVNVTVTGSDPTEFALKAVYGGGNQAAYTPTNNTDSTTVNITGCTTNIKYVFGGGNAAPVPAAKVIINGGVIDSVFAGGNGASGTSAAHVGYNTTLPDVTSAPQYGTGNASVHIVSGTIQAVFGGANSKGRIRNKSLLDINKTDAALCEMNINQVFGGGNKAAGKAATINVGCTGVYDNGEKINQLYGGANQADVEGDILLNITGGNISEVFGGNNKSGTISGTITVNVEITNTSCDNHISNVYGGGNQAAYTGNPVVNIKHGTIYGAVYGAGYGDNMNNEVGKVTGNPQVTIGDANPDHQVHITGSVFGGGADGNVDGTPTVRVLNKCNTIIDDDVYGGCAAAAVTNANVIIDGGTIGTVYGGGQGDQLGNAANVNSNVAVTITGGTIGKVFGGCNAKGSIGGTVTMNIDKGASSCDMYIGEVYGGGNEAAGKAGTVTIGCTGTLVAGDEGHVKHPENIGTTLEGVGKVFGGANQANVDGNIVLNIGSGIVREVFGGNNTSGEIAGGITVNINKNDNASCATNWYVKDVYGGGDRAWYGGTPQVNIQNGTVYGNVYGGGNNITVDDKGVGGSDVRVSGGQVKGGVYGGCNTKGDVEGASSVAISGTAVVGADGASANVYGGGLGPNTNVKGNVSVNVVDGTLWGHVYGGSAKGTVNSNASNTTEVNITGGTIHGDIFGGGEGEAGAGNVAMGQVNGAVTVNIGATSGGPNPTYSGNASLGGNIYGCNNTNGSPKDNVTVHIYKTAEATAPNFAIVDVFGGGNQANYEPSASDSAHRVATVYLHGCDNSVRRVFGGSNAAVAGTDSKKVTLVTTIDGGRYHEIYGGGNGEDAGKPAADIKGHVKLTIHGGEVDQFFVGSNRRGTVSESSAVTVDKSSNCGFQVNEFFCGGNYATIFGDVVTTLSCESGIKFKSLYGGCNMADITGNVVLTVNGGEYDTIYGGSKGVTAPGAGATAAQIDTAAADIAGNVTLNIYGGTIHDAVFGGSNVNGSIGGNITVTVEDHGGTCALDMDTAEVYGGGNLAVYTAPTGGGARANNPMVNINHATAKNVFGGGKGDATDASQLPGSVTGNPKVVIGDSDPDHAAIVTGNVYGGGSAAKVDGYTTVEYNDNNITYSHVSKLFGGGDAADVTGATTVTVTSGVVTGGSDATHNGVYGGCNNSGNVGGLATININGGTLGSSDNARIYVHGGGYGNNTTTTGNVNVTVGGGEIWGDVYGGSALGNVNDDASNTTNVSLTAGTIHGSLYGGGLGNNSHAAAVNGKVQVTVDGGTVTDVYGCNNVNGAPQSDVKVDINGTGGTLANVFGGGNQAAYSGTPVVTIHNCDNSISNVYGGGNAASVSGTDVTVYGGNTIGAVYGGCYGADVTTSGTAVKIHGGTIGHVFGGNNQSGSITGDVDITVNKETEAGHSACEMHITELYGGGNVASSKPAHSISIGCTGGEGEGIEYLYGGANQADVTGNIALTIEDGRIANVFGGNNTSGNISGTISVNINKKATPCGWAVGNVFGGGNHAAYSGTPEVTVTNGAVANVYGGGNEAGVGGGNVTIAGGSVTTGVYGGCNTSGVVDGPITVSVTSGTIGTDANNTANVHGGGYGNNTSTTGNVNVTVGGGEIWGDVYGGSALGNVNADDNNSTNVSLTAGTIHGSLYGGGLGDNNHAAAVNGKVQVSVSGGTVDNVFGANNANGAPQSTVTVDVTGSTCSVANVFGGGNEAHYGGTPVVTISEGTVGNVYGGGNNITGVNKGVGGGNVTISGGRVTTGVYGGCNTSGVTDGDITVNINGTARIGASGTGQEANVHGGGYGNNTSTTGNVKVNINSINAIIWGDVYGGSALGNIGASGKKDSVNLTAGTIHGNLYGGGLGNNSYAAAVNGDVQVTVTGGTVLGAVYGCNNANGTPTGTVKVDIYSTDMPMSGFALDKVFGGGNQAEYNGTPEVTIHNCDNSIKYLYGGGNKAKVYGTKVTVWGGTIDTVFAGGNGLGVADGYQMVTDTTHAYIHGGTIGKVFGGNNAKGSIGGTVNVKVDKRSEASAAACALKIQEVYGGGNEAPSQAGNVTIGCTGTLVAGDEGHIKHPENIGTTLEGVGKVFGGANQADITSGNIVLNIGSGIVREVFGGNNTSGEIAGGITVNINKDNNASCATNWYVKDVYGGGDRAWYGGTPQVNIVNGTVYGNVYGGGNNITVDNKGVGGSDVRVSGGQVNGNVYGGCNTKGTVVDASAVTLTGGIVKGSVFGGGKGANTVVTGQAVVHISGTDTQVETDVYGGGDEGVVNGGTEVKVF